MITKAPRPGRSLTIYTVKVTRKEPRPTLDTVQDIRFHFAKYFLALDFIKALPPHLHSDMQTFVTHTDVPYCIDAVKVWLPE